jgi:hypothetical protein
VLSEEFLAEERAALSENDYKREFLGIPAAGEGSPYQVDPALWVREVLGVVPLAWQEAFLRAPRGASILALTARQIGKTTTAAWGMTHTALHRPRSLSVVACPAQRQSAEAVRRGQNCR